MRQGALAAAALTAAALWSSTATAQSYVVWGIGAERCAAWVDAKRSSDKVQRAAYETWAHGFLTGAGFERGGAIMTKASMDRDGVLKWLDDYCEANPRMSIERAAVALLGRLGGEK